MNEPEAFAHFATIVADVFDADATMLNRTTTAADVDGWDSVSHATLIMAVEETYRFTFADAEIFSFVDLGALFDRTQQLRTC